MKKRSIIMGVVISALALQGLVGCESGGVNSLKIDDMLVYANGAPVAIETKFGTKAEAVSYEYDDYALSIEDGKIVCYKEGTYTITATSASCNTTFTVECKNAANIDDLYAWIDYPASDISPLINIPGETEITYSCDSDILSIDGGYVTALKAGTAEVTATVAGYETYFKVTCEPVDKMGALYYMWGDSWNWKGKATTHAAKYKAEGTDGKSTLFLGDSFFDPDFFSTFHSFYGDYDAFCMGIGGTTSHQWEMFFDGEGTYASGKYGQFAGIQPKNIVFQLGNNNIYNDSSSAKDATIDLQRFFTFAHGKMPNTQFYYFGVTPRIGVMQAITEITLEVNANMDKFCANKDWITFMDTNDKMTADKIKDNIHPKPEAYYIFVDALSDVGMKLEYRI